MVAVVPVLVSSEGSRESLNGSFKNVPVFKYANEQRLTLKLTTVFNRGGVIIVRSYSSLLTAHIKMKNT